MRFFVTKALTLLDSTFTQTACIFVVDLLVVCTLVKAESAISGHNEQRIGHLILDTHLIGKCMKVPVDVSAGACLGLDGLPSRKYLCCLGYNHLFATFAANEIFRTRKNF